MRKKMLGFGLFLALMTSQLMASVPTEPTVPATSTAKQMDPLVDENVVMDAMHQFKSLSRVERKARIAEAKKLVKEYKANASNAASTNTLLLAILAIILPPLAVYLHEGAVNTKFWISLLLSLLFWLPGVIYALIVVLS